MKKIAIWGLLLVLASTLSGCLVRDSSSTNTRSNEEIAAEALEKLEYFFRYNEYKKYDDSGLEIVEIMELFNDRKYDQPVVTISGIGSNFEQPKDYTTLEDELYEQKIIFNKQPEAYRVGVYYPMDIEDKDKIENQIERELGIKMELESILLLKDEDSLDLSSSERAKLEELKELKPRVISESQSSSKVIVGFFVLEQTEDILPTMTDWGEISFHFINEGKGWLIDHVGINYKSLNKAPIDGDNLDDKFVEFPAWVNETGND